MGVLCTSVKLLTDLQILAVNAQNAFGGWASPGPPVGAIALPQTLLLLLKSVEFDDDVALLLSVAGLVMGPHVTSESEIGGTDSAALRTSWTCLRLCGPPDPLAVIKGREAGECKKGLEIGKGKGREGKGGLDLGPGVPSYATVSQMDPRDKIAL